METLASPFLLFLLLGDGSHRSTSCVTVLIMEATKTGYPSKARVRGDGLDLGIQLYVLTHYKEVLLSGASTNEMGKVDLFSKLGG